MPRPVILISAVTPELESTRHFVANSLISLGYEPKWLDIPTTDPSAQRAEIRRIVDSSLAVLQIIGQQYGSNPRGSNDEFGPVSHTQYEALYASKVGKPVRYILLDRYYPTACENNESAALRRLQSDYRANVLVQQDLCHPSSTPRSTQEIVLGLRGELSTLYATSRKLPLVPAAFLCLLFLSVAIGCLLILNKSAESVAATENNARVGNDATSDQMEKALADLANAENRSRIPGASQTQDELRTGAYALLETAHGLKPGTLASSLPDFALKLYTSPDTELFSRASAAYALDKFEEAEKLFLEAESKGKATVERPRKGATDSRIRHLLALEGAAKIANARHQYARAVELYRAAAALTSVGRDPLEWGRIHHLLAYALTCNGQYPDAANILLQVIPVFEEKLGAEHPATLGSANNLASALNSQGRYAEAEQQHREILAIRLRTLGAEHPDTLTSRSNLAATLSSQGIEKQPEAEEQSRAVLGLRERILGSDHYEVFLSCHNLALSLAHQKKNDEGLVFAKRALDGFAKSLGEKHPNTKAARELFTLLKARLQSSANGAEH